MKHSQFIFVFLSFAVVFSCISCKQEEEQEVTELLFMHGWGGSSKDHQVMQSLYDSFKESNSDILMIEDSSPDISFVIEKATNMLAVDRMPDIISTNGKGDYLHNAIKKGTALNLTPYIKDDKEFLSYLPQEILNKITNGEKLYTIPDVMELQGFWYNEKLLKDVGLLKDGQNISTICKTWDDFFNICKSIKKYQKDKGSSVIPFKLHNEQFLTLFGILLGGSQEPEINNNIAYIPHDRFFDKDNIIETLNLLKEISFYAESITELGSIKDARESFMNGESIFFFNGVWDSIVLNNSKVASSIHHIPFPSKSGKTIAYRFLPDGYILGNRNDERNIHYSISFLKYMISTSVQEKIAYDTLQVPINPNVNISPSNPSLNSNIIFAESCENLQKVDIPLEGMYQIWSQATITYFLSNIIDFTNGAISAEKLTNGIMSYF